MNLICIDIVLLHGGPLGCMPYPVNGFLEIYEDMVQILLMLKILFNQYSKVENMFCGTSSDSEPSCCSAFISAALGFSQFKMTFSMTLLK